MLLLPLRQLHVGCLVKLKYPQNNHLALNV